MDFLKKHYEKALLGLVLLGLAAAVVFMLTEIPKEKAYLKETTLKRSVLNNKPLPAPEMERFTAVFARAEKPVPTKYSGPHNLFNPVVWKKTADNQLRKAQDAGDVASAVAITKLNPLYTTISYEPPGGGEPPAGLDGKFLVSIQRDADLKSSARAKRSRYVSKAEPKTEFFTLREVKGTPEKPELTLELADTGETVKVTAEQPFQRADGYSADLRYDPEKKTWAAKRVGDKLLFAGDEFAVAAIKLVATNQFEVVLSAKSTGKKTTIRFNGAM
jgi:hypothetical protein